MCYEYNIYFHKHIYLVSFGRNDLDIFIYIYINGQDFGEVCCLGECVEVRILERKK
ncbi:hypothetical protein CLU79DRAFT_765855 [Phycomyces nitens]|nr:hypothetical protein CLU79DRAFT_765855 [Phycomyces nitens]